MKPYSAQEKAAAKKLVEQIESKVGELIATLELEMPILRYSPLHQSIMWAALAQIACTKEAEARLSAREQ